MKWFYFAKEECTSRKSRYGKPGGGGLGGVWVGGVSAALTPFHTRESNFSLYAFLQTLLQKSMSYFRKVKTFITDVMKDLRG